MKYDMFANKKSLYIPLIIIGLIVVYTHTNHHGEYFLTEQMLCNQHKQNTAQAYWNLYVLEDTGHDHSLIKHLLTTQIVDQYKPENIIHSFNQSIYNKNFGQFSLLIHNLNSFGLSIIEHEKKLPTSFRYGNFYPCKKNIFITNAEIEKLRHYITDSSFSGIVSIQTPYETYTIASDNIVHHAIPFSIHSISKVFTELLLLIMIQEKVIPKSALSEKLLIDEKIINLLPETVIQQLQKTTMQQIIEHRGGFGDYTVNYFETLTTKACNNEPINLIEQLKDFLPYAQDTIVTLNPGENSYSNLGILLLGLSIEYHYNKNLSTENHLSFEQILNKYIVKPAEMHTFSSQKPQNGCYNESGLCAQYICGSPAGGHWSTAQDLHKFGTWLQKKYHRDAPFKELLSSLYFYNNDTEEMHHSGGIGQPEVGESCARFALFFKQGISIAILSNRPQQAFTMYQAIYHNIFADQSFISETQDE